MLEIEISKLYLVSTDADHAATLEVEDVNGKRHVIAMECQHTYDDDECYPVFVDKPDSQPHVE